MYKRLRKFIVLSCLGVALALGHTACTELPFLGTIPTWVSPLSQASAAKGTTSSLLLPIQQNGKFGYIDQTGTVVIPPQFNNAEPFSEGLAAVNLSSKWGYIDQTGRIVIQPAFAAVKPFSQGLAAVRVAQPTSDTKWGYIDKTGRTVIQPAFDDVESFAEGLSAVEVNRLWGYVDKTGRMVIKPQFSPSSGRSEPPHSFSEGLAVVAPVESNLGSGYGYINQAGKFVIKPQFRLANQFSEGLAPAEKSNKFGFIDRTGKFLIPPQFDLASPFSEGLAHVAFSDRQSECRLRLGYINKTGRIVIKPQFCLARPFSAGLAWTDRGLIDSTGRTAIPLQNAYTVQPFGNGFFQVNVGGKTGYIDKTGKYIWEPTK